MVASLSAWLILERASGRRRERKIRALIHVN
jgi:hypothetical protein